FQMPGDLATWQTPLRAEVFARWRDELPGKQDVVRRNGNYLTLETTAEHNAVRLASLIVREADFHPIEENLRFADDREIQLTEVALEIRDLPEPPIKARREAPREAGPAADPMPGEAELGNAELELRYLMYRNGWDMGEDLTVSRSTREVEIGGVASSA